MAANNLPITTVVTTKIKDVKDAHDRNYDIEINAFPQRRPYRRSRRHDVHEGRQGPRSRFRTTPTKARPEERRRSR